MKWAFYQRYFLLASALLLLEIVIAIWVHDHFIRPYVGDVLAPIFLYCLVRSFVSGPSGWIILGVLVVAYLVEVGQYFHLANHLGLAQYRLARIIMGTAFEWSDMLAYTLGSLIIAVVEQRRTPPTE